MKRAIFFILFLITGILLNAQTEIPKRELRGVWVATVTNLDWPSSPFLTVAQQKQELVNMFDKFKEAEINVVFFQIRTECDALYESPYEPWSYWLTGTQGKAPVPFYDPLKFAIDEAHKRGMELHAWLNPYRVEKTAGYYQIDQNHISKLHPEWILTVGNYKFLDPGLQKVRDYVIKIFMDVARRYTIDGIHMDDYFYSYDPISTQDTATFNKYNRGIADIKDWRRDNVNLFVHQLSDSLKNFNPNLKFGISPFGIWKPGVPLCTICFDAFNVLYCDPIHWLQAKDIDYITPQLYWEFGGGQDYGTLLKWWSDSTGANNRHLYTGNASYKISTFSASEIPNQIKANRNNINCQGSVFFEGIDFINNPKGFTDSLKNNYYRAPSLPPLMSWKESVPPEPPSNLRYELDNTSGNYALYWDSPAAASDGDSAMKYAVYRFENIPTQSDIENGNNLFGLIGGTKLTTQNSRYNYSSGNYYVVTSLDKNNNESLISNTLHITQTPQVPKLLSPAKGDASQENIVQLSWSGDEYTGGFSLQVSKDSIFDSDMIIDIADMKDTTFELSGLEGEQTYFWRVAASGNGGKSNYSETFNFTTAFPKPPVLSEPAHASTVSSINPALKWLKNKVAEKYNFQLSFNVKMPPNYILLDTTLVDTTITLLNLNVNKVYFWRVKASNQYGESDWSSIWGFKTPAGTNVEDKKVVPKSYLLEQNYPNPFNSRTIIKYSVPVETLVKLKVFNILGIEVATLVNEFKRTGNYAVPFEDSNLSSGIYFYKLETGSYCKVLKMILIK